jgi:phosphate-selective porin OprO/OprP
MGPGAAAAARAVTLPESAGDVGDDTAPSLSESAARPSRRSSGGATTESNLLPTRSFYDQSRYGYLWQFADGEFELRFNGLLQVDGRVYEQRNQNPVVNDINIPRARLYFSGRLTRPIEYQISLQRGLNNFDLFNAYVNFHYDDRFQLRAGRFKPPYTFEWYKMTAMEFFVPERSPFAENFGPNRQVGVMGWGFLFRERLEYAVAMAGGGRNSYGDFNDGKDVMALLDYKPYYQSGSDALKNFAIGGSVDAGRQNNPLVPAVIRTSVNGSGVTELAGTGDALVSPAMLAFNGNVRERGDRALWELHSTYYYRGLALQGAWDSGHNDFALTSPGARPVHLPVSGFFVQTAYLLTGESRERASLIEPFRPFDLRRGRFGLGAWEVQARYSNLTLGNSVFTGGLADPNLWSNRVDMVDAGFNWYLNKFVKVYFDWQHAVFAQPAFYRPGPGLQKTSDLFWLRLMIYL